ncbi:MAG TPA: Rrf2 family transcriptional regulator [Clostridiales bacterium]|nr:Rrf2 family transcriptional regulator [Clostridiales bacterium]
MTGEFIVAVHAIVFLNHKSKKMTSEAIAENVCTNPARIRKVMAKLKKANLIETKEGSIQGGYAFCLNPKEVTLHQIFNAVDDTVVSTSWKSGNPDMECLIASGMAEVMEKIVERMDDSCKEILKTITVHDIDNQIFNV